MLGRGLRNFGGALGRFYAPIRPATNPAMLIQAAPQTKFLQKKFNVEDTFAAWRRSEDNFVDLHVTEEDLEVITRAQERLLADERCYVSEAQATTFLTGRFYPPEGFLETSLEIIDRYLRKGKNYYAGRLYLKIYERCEDPAYLEMFGINRQDYAQWTYFLILHAWTVKRRLLFQQEDAMNFLLWEMVWNNCQLRLVKDEKIRESLVKKSMDSVKEFSVGLMLALEESLEPNSSKLGLGQFEWLLWTNVYSTESTAHKIRPDDPRVRELSAYMLYLQEFLLQIPPNEFRDGLFKLPPWPRTDLPEDVHLKAKLMNAQKLEGWTPAPVPQKTPEEVHADEVAADLNKLPEHRKYKHG